MLRRQSWARPTVATQSGQGIGSERLAKWRSVRYGIRVGVVRRHASRLRCVVGAALALVAGACGSDDGKSAPPARFAVLSAFPAELAAVLALTHVDETVTIDDHVFRLGTIGRMRVVVAMTG